MKKRLHRWVWPATLLLLLWTLRLLQAGSTPVAFDEEEGYVLAAAVELLDPSSDWPYQSYQLSDWENGTLLSVLLTVPLAALLGNGLLTLKLGALLWSSATLLSLWALVRRLAGARAATLAGALFVLFPGPILHHSVTLHGFHSDSTLFQLLYLWCLVLAHDRSSAEPRRALRWLACGIIGGFSIYFAYISAITVACGSAIALWRLLRPVRPGRALCGAAYLTGLVLGAAPLLVYNLLNRSGGLSVYGERSLLDFVNPLPLSETWRPFVEQTAPAWLHLSNWVRQDSAWHNSFNVCFWSVAGLAALWPWAARLRGARVRPGQTTMLDIAAPACWAVTFYVFFCSAHPIFPWHLFPLVVLLLALIALRASAWWSIGRPSARLAASLLALPLLGFGLVANIQAISFDRIGLGFGIQGRNIPLFFDRVNAVLDRSPSSPEVQKTRAELRRRWLSLPLEWAKAEPVNARFAEGYLGPNVLYTEFFGEALLQQALGETFTVAAVGRFLARPIAGVQRRQQAEVAGYCLGLLRRLETLSPHGPPGWQQIAATVQAAPPHLAGALLQGIGFALGRQQIRRFTDELRRSRLATHADLWSGQLLQGHGRGIRVAELLRAHRPLCPTADSQRANSPLARGAANGLRRRYAGPLPTAAEHGLSLLAKHGKACR